MDLFPQLHVALQLSDSFAHHLLLSNHQIQVVALRVAHPESPVTSSGLDVRPKSGQSEPSLELYTDIGRDLLGEPSSPAL